MRPITSKNNLRLRIWSLNWRYTLTNTENLVSDKLWLKVADEICENLDTQLKNEVVNRIKSQVYDEYNKQN
jgi:hypothetical protein